MSLYRVNFCEFIFPSFQDREVKFDASLNHRSTYWEFFFAFKVFELFFWVNITSKSYLIYILNLSDHFRNVKRRWMTHNQNTIYLFGVQFLSCISESINLKMDDTKIKNRCWNAKCTWKLKSSGYSRYTFQTKWKVCRNEIQSNSIILTFPPCKLSLIHIWRCRRYSLCRSRWSPYH